MKELTQLRLDYPSFSEGVLGKKPFVRKEYSIYSRYWAGLLRRYYTVADSPKQPTPTWYKALNVIIGIIALIMAIGVVFFPFLLGGGTVVIFLSLLLVVTGFLKAAHAYQYADYPNWLRWLTIIFGIILIVLALPLILIGTTETIVI